MEFNTHYYVYKDERYENRKQVKEAVDGQCTTKDFIKLLHWGIITEVVE